MRPVLCINCSLLKQPKQTLLTVNKPRSHGQMKTQLGNTFPARGWGGRWGFRTSGKRSVRGSWDHATMQMLLECQTLPTCSKEEKLWNSSQSSW